MLTESPSAPLVSIVCLTYNHEDCIGDAVSGFLSQQTDFDVQILISDDQSSDGTSDILRGFSNRHPGRLEVHRNPKNLGMQKNFVATLKRARGKYIAICDGDDYWVDDQKLHKQVGVLESNPQTGVVFSGIYVLPEISGASQNELVPIETKPGLNNLSYQSLLFKNEIYTCSSIFRRDLLDNFVDLSGLEQQFIGDYPLWLEFSNHSTITFLDDKTAVYRMRENTASVAGSRNSIAKIRYLTKLMALKMDFIDKYPVDSAALSELKAQHALGLFRVAYEGADLELMAKQYATLKQVGRLKFWHRCLYFMRRSTALRKLTLTLYRFISRRYGISELM